jgi:alkylhydroperoxidase/carboxymuconolactone decarboxylase family protein YurZ
MAKKSTKKASSRNDSERIEELKQKYGAGPIENGLRLRPNDFLDEVDWRDRIDQHYTRIWLQFTYGGLFTRKGLDERTRLLVSLAQFLSLGELEEFERQIPAALAGGATPREVLEVALQATVYIGYIKAGHGARICVKVFEALGRLDEITQTQLPLDGRLPERSLEEERGRWPEAKTPEEAALREQLLEKYGWSSMSSRIRLQAHQGYDTMTGFDRIDPHYLKLWLDFIYGEMYPRGILDDRTRLLLMVAICLALNEPVQLENHIRGSLRLGATPREVLEVIVQSTAYVGMPTTILMRRMLERVAKEENRFEELLP